ncbi:coiled-coil domain-containing protein 57 isoform X6 [Platichthys flesus]|nr:coiled-coil domain-containing protein 57 isoform X5 [Platichthys flesus]XP_062269721.1 coiled-coil domain-containing protein 57 isoform X6 [Platichthys flesus]
MKAKFILAKQKLIQELTHSRDQDFIPRVELLASEEICHLKEQNSILRAAFTQMRKDMECLNHPLFDSQAQPQAAYPQPVQLPGSPAATSITATSNTEIATRLSPHCTNLSSKVRNIFWYKRQPSSSAYQVEAGSIVYRPSDQREAAANRDGQLPSFTDYQCWTTR